MTDPPRRGSWGFQPSEETWERRLQAVAEFRDLHGGRWPRSTRPAESDERRLGQWLGTQRRELRSLGLSRERHERLDQVLPGWQDRQLREARHDAAEAGQDSPGDPGTSL